MQFKRSKKKKKLCISTVLNRLRYVKNYTLETINKKCEILEILVLVITFYKQFSENSFSVLVVTKITYREYCYRLVVIILFWLFGVSTSKQNVHLMFESIQSYDVNRMISDYTFMYFRDLYEKSPYENIH